MLHDKSKKNNNRQWNNKTESYKIGNIDEMQLRIMINSVLCSKKLTLVLPEFQFF